MTRPRGMDLLERVVLVEAQAAAAHKRQDTAEQANARAWEEVKTELKGIRKDLGEVIGWMNRGKGWAAAGLLAAGTAGALITKALGFWSGGSGKT